MFIYGTKPMSWFRRRDWRCLQTLQRRLIYLFNTWAAMCTFWKCIVRASNHCEVDRQRSSTQDLFNTIIRLGRRINGTGVCSNSIESSTNTNRKFALAWQLVMFLFTGTVLQPKSPSNPLPAATDGRLRQLVTMMKINTTCQTTASYAPRSAKFSTLY